MKNSRIIIGSSLVVGTAIVLGLVSWNSNIPTKRTETAEIKNESPDTSGYQLAMPIWDLGKHFSGKGGCKIPEVNFYYNVGTRFKGISKEEIQLAKSFKDYMINDHFDRITEIHSLKLIFFKDDQHSNQQEEHKGSVISEKQRQLLLDAPISSNFVLEAHCTRKMMNAHRLEKANYTPHLTIVPSIQASYKGGVDALISYFKENSKDVIKHAQSDQLTPAKIYFTVNKHGSIENIKLSNTTSYPEIDKHMVELVKEMPLNWTPAKDENGNNVNQELVYFFAVEGC